MRSKPIVRAGLILGFSLLMSTGCATSPPRDTSDICNIFQDKRGWHRAATKAHQRWQAPIPVMMAFIHQESRYHSDIRPPRKRILWVLPGPRPSSAFGYAQAIDETWDAYRDAVNRRGADRDDFADAVDFIGWYNLQTQKKNKVRRDDTYHLYLAYHEGHGGFARGTYKNKGWLKGVARKVSQQSKRYEKQYTGCQDELDSGWWPFG